MLEIPICIQHVALAANNILKNKSNVCKGNADGISADILSFTKNH